MNIIVIALTGVLSSLLTETKTPTVDAVLMGAHVDPRRAENWLLGMPAASEDSGTPTTNGPKGPSCRELSVFKDFEVVEVIFGQDTIYHRPRMNNCGEIVFTRDLGWQKTSEIFRYDNGYTEQLTNNTAADAFPDINDFGETVWVHNYDGFSPGEIWLASGDNTLLIGTGTSPATNNLGHVAWKLVNEMSCAFEAAILHYNGVNVSTIIDDGLSNQSPMINDLGQISWTRYHFCPVPWTSDIMLFTGGQTNLLPSAQEFSQRVRMDNTGRVVWMGKVDTANMVERWADGASAIITAGASPVINDHGEIAYTFKSDFTPWSMWLWNDGTPCRVTSQEDIDNLIDNINVEINNFSELTWAFSPNGQLTPSGIRYLRRIRSGDIDLNDLVEFADFQTLPGCMTGTGDFDRLCDCRFFDMQHDRDVDVHDALEFQNRYDRVTLDGNDCCLEHDEPGCNDPAVESCVCTQAPSCCNEGWHSGCILTAELFGCADCLAPFLLDVAVETPIGGTPDEITVPPGANIPFRIVAQLTDDVSNDGLAGFVLDLKFANEPLTGGSAEPAPGMGGFAAPQGLTNPSGFGGLLGSGVLHQIGGLQNTFGDGGVAASNGTGSPMPTGEVVTGIAHGPMVIVTGTFAAPDEQGEYSLTIDNLAANALTAGPSPTGAWQTRQAGVGSIDALTVIVGDTNIPIPAMSTWGVGVLGLLMLTMATIVYRNSLGEGRACRRAG